jgi:DNA-directed RNA polymerase alpha subunit
LEFRRASGGKLKAVGAWTRLADFLDAELSRDDVPDVLQKQYGLLQAQAHVAIAEEERPMAHAREPESSGKPLRNQPQGRNDAPLVDDAIRHALAVDARPVDALPMTRLTVRALAQADVFSIGELVALPPGFVDSLPGVGPKSLAEIRDALVALAWSMPADSAVE